MRAALALLVCATLTACCAIPAVRSLDAASFRTLLLDGDIDLLCLFIDDAELGHNVAVLDILAGRLRLTASSAIVAATYNVNLHGVPAGLHLHGGAPSVWLFPAAERDPVEYDFLHDAASVGVDVDGSGPAAAAAPVTTATGSAHEPHSHTAHVHSDGSTCNGHSHGEHDAHGHEHEHEHEHEGARLTVLGLQLWLRKHTTFPAEVPDVKLEERWAGREAELAAAVSNGAQALLAVLRERSSQVQALQQQVAALQQQVRSLQQSCCTCTPT